MGKKKNVVEERRKTYEKGVRAGEKGEEGQGEHRYN